MNKKPSFDITRAVADPISTQTTVSAKEIAERPAPKAPKPAKGPRGSARPGARGVTVYIEEETFTTLKLIGIQERLTTQEIVEALIVERCKRHK